LIRLSNRLGLIAYYYEDLPDPKAAFDHERADSLHRFLYGQDRLAMLQASYAFSMKPDDAQLGHLLDDMEKAVKIKATRLSPDSPRGFIDELLYQAEFANTRGDMGRVETLLDDTLVLEPENATALERLGSLRYLTGRLPEAISAWEAAAKIETRDRELESLHEYLRVARERAVGKPLPGGTPGPLITVPDRTAAPAAVPAASPAAAPEPASEAAAAPSQPSAPAGDPRDIADLYQKGVEHYARGEYLEASAMFLRILEIDPNNAQANKALERIRSRDARR
jgi:tetratricopeptide (TPR) repeat protein